MQQMMRQMDLMRQALGASQARQSEMQQAFTVSVESRQARQNEALLQVQGALIDVQNRSSSQSTFRGVDLLKSAVKAPCSRPRSLLRMRRRTSATSSASGTRLFQAACPCEGSRMAIFSPLLPCLSRLLRRRSKFHRMGRRKKVRAKITQKHLAPCKRKKKKLFS